MALVRTGHAGGGAGTEEAKREETVFSKVKASMHPASGWVKGEYAKMC